MTAPAPLLLLMAAASASAPTSEEICVRGEVETRGAYPGRPATPVQRYAQLRRDVARGRSPLGAFDVGDVVAHFRDAAPTADGRVLEVQLSAAAHPFDPLRALVQVRAQAPDLPPVPEHGARVTWLIDQSSSMETVYSRSYSVLHDEPAGQSRYRPVGRLDLVRALMHEWASQARGVSRVAIATYGNGEPRELLPPTSLHNQERVHAAIDALSTEGRGGGTEGLPVAWRLARRMETACADNHVVVVSDAGSPIGHLADRARRRITDNAERGTRLSFLSVGLQGDESPQADRLAWSGHGESTYADTLAEGRRALGRIFASQRLVARNASVTLSFDPEQVRSAVRLGGDLGAAHGLRAGDEISALYEVTLAAPPTEGWAQVGWSATNMLTGGPDRGEIELGPDLPPLVRADAGIARSWVAASFARQLDGPIHVPWARLAAWARASVQSPSHDELVVLIDKAAETTERDPTR